MPQNVDTTALIIDKNVILCRKIGLYGIQYRLGDFVIKFLASIDTKIIDLDHGECYNKDEQDNRS